MKLETSLELLERIRARLGNVSYYRVAKILELEESTVLNWKAGKAGIGRGIVPRIAELLDEPPEYVLACVEHEREPSAGVRRIWRRIAEAFRSKAAAIGAIILIALVDRLFAPNLAEAKGISPAVSRFATVLDTHYANRPRRLRGRWWRDLVHTWLPWLPQPALAWGRV